MTDYLAKAGLTPDCSVLPLILVFVSCQTLLPHPPHRTASGNTLRQIKNSEGSGK